MLDEKGRIFGKINLIDLLVLLVAIVAAVVLAARLVGSRLNDPEATATLEPTPTPVINTSLIEYTVRYTRMDPAEYEEIKKHFDGGDRQLLNSDGSEAEGSQVVEIGSEPYMASVTDEDGTIHVEADPYFVNVLFTLRSETDNAESNAFYGQEVRIGRSFLIRTRYYELSGLIVDCETLEVYPPEAGE